MGTLSVVIPSLNDARMLEQCLADLAVQTRAPDEIIVVDNGSTDDTAAVALAAGARLVHEPVRGVLHATAAGFDAACGDVIGRLDADSRPAADWAARVERRFESDATLGALTGTGVFYGCGPVLRAVAGRVYLGGYFWFMGMIVGQTPVFGSNFALRREVWSATRDAIHLDDPRAHDDLDISFALGPDVGVDYDPELHVGVSARPFDDGAGLRRRASWAFHGIAVNWAEVGWWTRRRRCARGRRARRAAQRLAAVRHLTSGSDQGLAA
ncbi:glycosyltransferase family 2 protein [Agromyces sp. SYSU T00194]|uniref:glycosyltransferase family 2 protein n=1 Tax=Agromyces chitinivorans TaxID=3158560 RepID=UPI0033977FED